MLIELNPRVRAAIKARRIERDCGILLAAPTDRPVPVRSAPWRPGPRDEGMIYPGERPWMVHNFTHFETFASVGALLERWVIDEQYFVAERQEAEHANN